MSDVVDISRYLEFIPPLARWKLDKELDYDNEFDRDLMEIAKHITSWEVRLRVQLRLTEPDVYEINEERDLRLRQ